MDVEEWERSHKIALQKMSDIMIEGRDIGFGRYLLLSAAA